jgi:hypothetical protein
MVRQVIDNAVVNKRLFITLTPHNFSSTSSIDILDDALPIKRRARTSQKCLESKTSRAAI